MSPRLISCLLVIITSLSVCQDSFFTEICNQKFQHCCKCDSSLLSVVCFKCPLIEALLVPSWTRIISIQYCHMTLLDLANFNASGRLEILIFTHNDLEVIHPGTFDQLVNLRLLDLSHNQLVSLPQNLLVNSEKLQILHLSNNNFDNLDVIGKLLPTELTLEQLSLNKNNFAYANGNVKIPSAKSLDLSGNQMIRKLIGNRIYLSSVDYLATIDTESLEQLTLAHCKAEVLVDFEFGRLYKGLKNLDLTDNSITSSNGNLISLLMLTNLTHLNLSQSALSIGSWNWYLSNLITLNISYSMVDSIQFHQESQLQVLDVSGNDVGEISHLEHLPDLQMLSAR